MIGECLLLLLFIFTREIGGRTCCILRDCYQFYHLWKVEGYFWCSNILIIWKTLLWWIISSERKHYENQDHAVVLIEIKAAGKLFERLMTTKDFMKHSAWAAPHFKQNSDQTEIKKGDGSTNSSRLQSCCNNLQTLSRRWLYLHNRKNVWTS